MQMGSIEENIDLESDEEIPFSSSQATDKLQNFHFETSRTISEPNISSSWASYRLRNSIIRSIYIVLIKAKINVLLPFGPLAILLHYLTGKHVRSKAFPITFLLVLKIYFKKSSRISFCGHLFNAHFLLVGMGLLFHFTGNYTFSRAPGLCNRVSVCLFFYKAIFCRFGISILPPNLLPWNILMHIFLATLVQATCFLYRTNRYIHWYAATNNVWTTCTVVCKNLSPYLVCVKVQSKCWKVPWLSWSTTRMSQLTTHIQNIIIYISIYSTEKFYNHNRLLILKKNHLNYLQVESI